ncbi:MAG: TolC family protein [Elusimicrobiota bacterium]
MTARRSFIQGGFLSIAAILSVVLAVSVSAESDLKRPSEIPLTPESAVEVALNRSPALKAARARARADQANARADGRPEDPKLVGDYKVGSGVGRTELAITFDIWSLVGAGYKRRASGAAGERADAALAEEASALAADAKSAVYAVQAASATLVLRRDHAQAARAMADLALGQRKAGNIPALDLYQEQAAAETAELDVDRAEAQLTAARAELARLLRVPTDSGWWTEAVLPAPPEADPDLAALAALATARRPARRAALAAARAAEQSAKAWSSTSAGALRLGAAAEREPDGTRLAGPAFEMDLPLFNSARPRLEAADARADEAAAQADEVDAELTAELESLRAHLVSARKAARRWGGVIVPARAGITAETQLRYNGMLAGAAQLLSVRQAETDARRELIEALRDYWTTRAALERAVGGSLPEGKS